MELYEFQILIGQIGSGHHGGAVTGAGVRGRARKIGASVTTRSEHRVLGVETMQRSVLETERDHTPTLAALHQQIEGEILDEVIAVVAQRLAVERV